MSQFSFGIIEKKIVSKLIWIQIMEATNGAAAEQTNGKFTPTEQNQNYRQLMKKIEIILFRKSH